jgi:DNA-binding LacI/PurR family transcriptional regulator
MSLYLNGYRTSKLYTQVLNKIRRSLRPGDRLGTQVDLARDYGVSVQTMQRVLTVLARQGWVVRSRRSGTFVAPRPAQVGRRVLWLMNARPQTLLASPFHRGLLACVAYRVTEMGAWIRVMNGSAGDGAAASAVQSWQALVDGIDMADADAVVALAPEDATPLADIAAQLPVIVIESAEASKACSTVCLDHRRIVATAMSRLTDLGHQRVGFWGLNFGMHGPRTRASYQAYLEWSAHAGRVPARHWLSLIESEGQYSRSADQLAGVPPDARPTALLLCGGASEAVRQLAGRGINVGQDISAISVGVDGQCHPPAEQHPPAGGRQPVRLAGFQPDLSAMGRLVAEELHRRLTDATARPRSLLVPSAFGEFEI